MIEDVRSEEYEKNWIDCRINSLRYFLLQYNIDLSRNYIFLLSEAYTYYFMYIDFQNTNVLHIPFVAASESCLEDNVFKALCLETVTKRLDESLESLDFMKKMVKSGKPILMHAVEQLFIKHVEVLNKLKVNIRMQSIPVLVDIDKHDNYVLYWSTSSQMNPIMIRKKDEIDRLRSIECVPYPPDYLCTYVTDISQNISKDDLVCELHHAVKRVTIKMIKGAEIDVEAKKNLNATESYIGLSAMRKMRDFIEEMIDTISTDSNNVDYVRKCYLSVLIAKIGLFKGSITSFRKEFGEALMQFANDTDNQRLYDISKYFLEVSHYWKKLFVQIGKMNGDLTIDSFISLYNIFDSIYKLECIAFNDLANYYNISEENL